MKRFERQTKALEEEIGALRRDLEELTRSLPKHSLKPTQLAHMEELEDQIEEKEQALARLKAIE